MKGGIEAEKAVFLSVSLSFFLSQEFTIECFPLNREFGGRELKI